MRAHYPLGRLNRGRKYLRDKQLAFKRCDRPLVNAAHTKNTHLLATAIASPNAFRAIFSPQKFSRSTTFADDLIVRDRATAMGRNTPYPVFFMLFAPIPHTRPHSPGGSLCHFSRPRHSARHSSDTSHF